MLKKLRYTGRKRKHTVKMRAPRKRLIFFIKRVA